jgi:L-alanine-DL-glutamate epimerase-like enolase superfamily enzyme
VKRSLLRLSLPFREPYTTSNAVVSERQLLLLRLESADGFVGYGEAAPFEPYDGIPLERAIATLTRRSRGRRPPPARAASRWRGSTSTRAATAVPWASLARTRSR